MKFRIEKEQPYILQVGDLVVTNDTVGSVCRDEDDGEEFIIRHIFDSKYGFTGRYPNLKELTKSLSTLSNVQVFSKDQYELVLKRKTNNSEGEIIHE